MTKNRWNIKKRFKWLLIVDPLNFYDKLRIIARILLKKYLLHGMEEGYSGYLKYLRTHQQ